MINRREKKVKKIFFNQVTYFFIGLILLTLIVYPLSKKLSQHYGLNKEIKELEKEIESLKGRSSELHELITYLESDQFTEEAGRLNLNLKKEGEEVVVISHDKLTRQNDKSLDTKNNKNVKTKNNLQRWWLYFFN